MKNIIKFVFVLISMTFISCGTNTSTKENNSGYNDIFYPQEEQETYDASQVKVSINNGSEIFINAKDLGNWGTYIVGWTTNESNYTDNPIEASTLYKDISISCTKMDENEKELIFYCERLINYGNYTYYDSSGIGNYLNISKSGITYLYERPFLNSVGYIVGEFSYKNGKILYSPYKKTKKINLIL